VTVTRIINLFHSTGDNSDRALYKQLQSPINMVAMQDVRNGYVGDGVLLTKVCRHLGLRKPRLNRGVNSFALPLASSTEKTSMALVV